jgi:hypothetical protein
MQEEEEEEVLFKGNTSRFTIHNFGTVITQQVDVQENLLLSGIVTVTPTEGGIVYLVHDATITLISNIDPYIQLTFLLPENPKFGQVIILTTNADISSIVFDGNGETFSTPMPTSMVSGFPIRMAFGDSWILI